MALNLHWVFDDFHNGFCPSRVCLFLNECLKSFIKTLQPEVPAEQKRLSVCVWGGGGGGCKRIPVYTKELAILIPRY